MDRDALLAGGSLISDFLSLADEARSGPGALERIREMLAGDLAHPRAARIIRDMSDEELVALVDRAESVGIGLLLGEEV